MRFSTYLKNLLNIFKKNVRIFVIRPMTNIKWYVTNSSELRRYHQHRFSKNVIHLIHVRHLLCTIFVRKIVKNIYIFFQNLSHKNAQIVNLKNPDFGFDPKNPPWEWNLWIHDPFLDLPSKNAKSLDFCYMRVPRFCATNLSKWAICMMASFYYTTRLLRVFAFLCK